MEVKIELTGQVMTAYLSGEIDHHSIRPVREEIDRFAEGAIPKLLLLDFTDVTFMDSSGIGLVMGRYKLLKSMGGEVKVTNPTPHIKKVMHLAGLDRLAVIEDKEGKS
ncbi:STAS domain-containing protein [Massilioclostridium coli]|uniref:STAS domain-containing protein n=1 Tax=Massilioclostridium coli TaxID=1870991 RepID=UPI0022E24A87|nr:STAS domain-containing protein [Massilioclostridium coli]